ncbi:hypothetical protein DFS34DRAFT_640287 [Phlyctochytrium arcticum]|nr:hypothetical protein DFS34DRAFT_640287 [Phlyctochytrium arcticum]
MRPTFTAATAVLLLVSAVSAQKPIVGNTCTAAVDKFGCNGLDFLFCENDRWVRQNACSVACIDDPSVKSNCFSNSQGGSGGGTPTPSSSSTPSTSISPTNAGNAGAGESKSNAGAIAGGVIGGLIGLALILAAIFFLRRRKQANAKGFQPPSGVSTLAASGKRQEEGLGMSQAGSSSTLGPSALSVASVLEKKYVVRHNYEPAADDEIRLTVGEPIRLDLLFNDGWAKGTNETTGQQGLLPVACLQEA